MVALVMGPAFPSVTAETEVNRAPAKQDSYPEQEKTHQLFTG